MLNDDGYSVKGCTVIYAPKGQAGEYSKLATNPYRGCGHACVYCLAPDTLIQMADGTTRKLAAVNVGDDLIGVVKRPEVRRSWNWTYKPSRVLAKIQTHKLSLRITLENGQSAICSPDHRWLTERGWKHAENLTLNNRIRLLGPASETLPADEEYRRGYLAGIIHGDATLKRYDYSGKYQRTGKRSPQKTDVQHHFRLAMIDAQALDRTAAWLEGFGVWTYRAQFSAAVGARAPLDMIRTNSRSSWEKIGALIQERHNPEWLRGWLAGIFDAEGGTTADCIRIHNTDAGVLETTDRALASLGFGTIRDVVQANGCSAVRVLGGIPEAVRFFNLTAPAILRKFPLPGHALRGGARVVGIETAGGAMEMFDITTSTENFIANGMISHNCYVPAAIFMPRAEFDAGAMAKPDFLNRLCRDAARYRLHGITEQVLLSFTTDPYHPGDNHLTRQVLQGLKIEGLAFCTLTKGGTRALRDIDLFRQDRDAFASTLTTLDKDQSREWEPNAALPADRLATLKQFHDAGIFTWVSLEPVYDTEMTIALIKETVEYVDLYKIGRINYHRITKEIDWRRFTEEVLRVVSDLGKKHYIKKDLHPFLPAGYDNPLRIDQHRLAERCQEPFRQGS